MIRLMWFLCNSLTVTSQNADGITLMNGNGGMITFDIMIPTALGVIFVWIFLRCRSECSLNGYWGNWLFKKHMEFWDIEWRVNKENCKWTQVDTLRLYAQAMPPLYKGQGKAESVCKESKVSKAEVSGGRVYLDLSKVNTFKMDGPEFELSNKWWKTIVNKAIGKTWCDFTPTKVSMMERMCKFLHATKQRGTPNQIIWLQPAGEIQEPENHAGSVDV